ncbi:MAG: hypothetical protein JKY32_05565 [Rhizobiales bacterium]|nr:hypothetical protein [Hyphomicrobiales bacterium]
MSKSKESVRVADSEIKTENDWLKEQIDIAINNLKATPKEQRGIFVVTDEDLNVDFELD